MRAYEVLAADSRLERVTKFILILGFLIAGFALFSVVWGASTSTFSQTIAAGTLSVDIVDANGTAVAAPTVAFPSYTTQFTVGTSTATFGTSAERVRVSNPTANAVWSLTFAPTGTQAVWFGAGGTYGYKSQDNSTGTMQVDPSIGTLAGVSGCATTNVTKGTLGYFSPSVQSRTLASAASGAPTFCRWDLTGVGIKQEIPLGQAAGSYQIGMTVTVA